MYKKTMTYTDYNGVEREETFYFNLTKAELLEMEMTTTGGMVETIQTIIKAKDTPSLIKTFKEVLLHSYGEKSLDGKRFVKSKELSEAFAQTEAYSQMFMELATNADAAIEFINGIIPNDVNKQAALAAGK